MESWRRLILRLRNSLLRKQAERELSREVDSHLGLIEDEYRRRGLTPEAAQLAARKAFGGIDQAKELQREERTFPLLDHLREDLRYAFRTLRKTPGFVFVVIVSLAIGIGTTTATFSQVNGLFWKTLAVKAPDRLQILSWTSPQQPDSGESSGLPSFSYPAYASLRDRAAGVSELACWARVQGNMVDSGRFSVTVVSGNYFHVLGVDPLLGRTIGANDDRAGNSAHVAVLSYGIWKQVFGSDPNILTRKISIKGMPFQIVGVMPNGFAGLDPVAPVDVIVPRGAASIVSPFPSEFAEDSWSACRVFGRIRSGVSTVQARTELNLLFHQITLNTNREDARLSLTDVGHINSLETQRQKTSLPLFVLLSIAGIILLSACANIAGLLLIRGHARQKEIATRLAMGAPRARIVRQLLTESLLLSMTGGTFGIGLAFAFSPLLPALLARFDETLWLGQPIGLDMTPDLRVLAFSIAVSVLTGVVFGLLPALRTTCVDLTSMMKQGSGVSALRGFRFSGGKALIAVQVALSMILLIGAGLFIRTVANLAAVPLGYDPHGMLFVNTVLDEPSSESGETRTDVALIEKTTERLEKLSGVVSASASPWPIYHGGLMNPVCVPNFSSDPQSVDMEPVLPRFFTTWGVRFLEGRDFSSAMEPAVVVNETFARKFFQGADPLGASVEIDGCPGTPMTIIGVVADARNTPREEQLPMIYVRYPWGSGTGLAYGSGLATYAVRTVGDAQSMAPAIRRFFADLGRNVIGDVTTGTEWRGDMVKSERSLAGLFVFFGSLGLLISCLGVFGILAYTVNRRTPEIGVRMALGAQRSAVVGIVIRETLAPVVIGIATGSIVSFGLTRWIESMLFGISKQDPWTIAGATMIFLLTAAVAAFLPVRRASRIDPAGALRYE